MRYSFEGFSLDVDARELRRGADVVSIASQLFDLIAYLVRHRARVITKDELIEEIWGGRIISETALTTRLYVARKTIGQRLIKTFPRKGVRFVGIVRDESSNSDAPPSMQVYDAPATGRNCASRPSIVVFPFTNLSGNPRLDALAESIREDVSTELLKLRDTILIAAETMGSHETREKMLARSDVSLACAMFWEGACEPKVPARALRYA